MLRPVRSLRYSLGFLQYSKRYRQTKPILGGRVETDSARVFGAFGRDFRADDLLECLSINPGRIGDELVGRARAIEIWRSLISSRSFTSAVIQADSPIAGQQIVGFGASVFVQPGFVDEEFSSPRPGLNARVFARI